LSLPTKYRPKDLASVIGQAIPVKIVASVLKRFDESGKDPSTIPNSIILKGPYGSGKTTISRIIARYLNCDHGPQEVCGECKSCKEIDKDIHHDLMEIDAATYSGKENIQELQKLLGYAVRDKYRVIIFDEAHKLSSAAWDALLKTLEESKINQIFVFATTDAQKIPDTIFSRSFTLNINVVNADQIAERIAYIADAEQIMLQEQVAATIAFFSKGHVRDAVQLLEISAIICENKTVTLNDVYLSAGMQDIQETDAFVNFFYMNDFANLSQFCQFYTNSTQSLLKSAISHIHRSILQTETSTVTLKDKITLLRLLQLASMDFTKYALAFPFVVDYFHRFQRERII